MSRLDLSLDSLQMASGICLWKVELQTGTVAVGSGWQLYLGGEAPTRLSDWLEMFHPVDKAEVVAILESDRLTPGAAVEVRVRHKGGGYRWVRLRGGRLKDEQVILGFAEEITELKDENERKERRRVAAEEELRASEERYRSLFDHTTEHLFFVSVDEKGVFRYDGLNPAHQRATGLRDEDLRGKTPEESLPLDVASHVEANYRRCCDLGTPISYEETVVLPRGPISWFTQLIPLRNSTGRIHRLVGICTDLTALKEKEQALRLIQKEETVGLIAAGIAHDFNNLLTVIIGQLGLMEMTIDRDSELEESVKEIGEAADRAAALTQGLLRYTMGTERTPTPHDPVALTTEIRKMLSSIAGPLVKIEYQLDETSWAVLDPVQYHQILFNLVGNAAEAMRGRAGHIEIRLGSQDISPDAAPLLLGAGHAAGEYVTLEVVDDGPGIEEALQSSLFESGVSSKGDGRGLGLYTVKAIVERFGGAIKVESTPGAGTSMKVFFPAVATGVLQVDRPEPSSYDPLPLGRMLVYSADSRFRRTLAEMLKVLGLNFEAVSKASELMALLAGTQQGVGAVLIDPADQSEWEKLARGIKLVDPKVRVGLIGSGWAAGLLMHEDSDIIAGFLKKPFDLAALHGALRNLLAQ